MDYDRNTIIKDRKLEVSSTIRNQSALAGTAPNQYVFESRGRSGVSGLLVLCDKSGIDDAKTVVVTAGGTIQTTLALNGTGAKMDPWGGVLECP